MNWDTIDWPALERMRAAFLDSATGQANYWQREVDVASYDQTFAQRIGWKWDYVLAELTRRGWAPPAGELLDWGCGSGIAHRAFLHHFGTEGTARAWLWDRSPVALRFAIRRAQQQFPKLEVASGLPDTSELPPAVETLSQVGQSSARGLPSAPALLLLSHVLTELDDTAREQLLAIARRTTAVIWVEPGTYDASRALVAVREQLRGEFQCIAPCTHQAPCGMLAEANAPHWCHHFAAPPPAVFTDSNWSRFSRLTGIDLRSLPLSFLVLDRRSAPSLPAGAVRIIGRPRVYKAHALLLGCEAGGVQERRLNQRSIPDEFRRLKKGTCDPLQIWRCEGDALVEASSVPSGRLNPKAPGENRIAGVCSDAQEWSK